MFPEPRRPPPAAAVAVVGAGPAGLMAAEDLAARGVEVEVYDAMPSPGRKFLMAGRGGLNITHSEAFDRFLTRYGAGRGFLEPSLTAFGPAALRDWMAGLGIASFVGSSGRVFPEGMKAAPLLRAWLHRLRSAGVRLHVRHRWLGWQADGALRFATPTGELAQRPAATVLALGGGSWRRLGSDGAWVPWLAGRGVDVVPLRPANCGFDVAWSPYFRERFAGQPLKAIVARHGGQEVPGECVVSARGIEGGAVYALSASLREGLARGEATALVLDLAPGRDEAALVEQLARPRGRDSLANHLRRRAGIEGVKTALLREFHVPAELGDAAVLARAIKALAIPLQAPRPLDEAISSAGGVALAELTDALMLKTLPGVFCAGEMLDWEAPTGGYLLTACLATGRRAGEGVAAWLERVATK
ncbi:MAG: TIGR03862 family flavoprotein [Dechloromonas sp.]|jgi:uncharacterized flavoprotein (TIGR03862 family)|nr:TIGR03862 family flavoprotein [Dechloromonas sp.]